MYYLIYVEDKCTMCVYIQFKTKEILTAEIYMF